MDGLRELLTACNIYIKEVKSPSSVLLYDIALYVTKILKVFGTVPEKNLIGFPTSQEGNTNNVRWIMIEIFNWLYKVAFQVECVIMPYLGIMAEFRDSIRNTARELKATEILKECDRLRDDVLPTIGVRLEDREGEWGDAGFLQLFTIVIINKFCDVCVSTCMSAYIENLCTKMF